MALIKCQSEFAFIKLTNKIIGLSRDEFQTGGIRCKLAKYDSNWRAFSARMQTTAHMFGCGSQFTIFVAFPINHPNRQIALDLGITWDDRLRKTRTMEMNGVPDFCCQALDFIFSFKSIKINDILYNKFIWELFFIYLIYSIISKNSTPIKFKACH